MDRVPDPPPHSSEERFPKQLAPQDHAPEDQAVEDLSAERAVERLGSGWIPQDSGVADSGDADIRSHLEVLALLAYELEPEAPRPEVKSALMARVRRLDGAAGAPAGAQVTPLPLREARGRNPVDRTLRHKVVEGGEVKDFPTHTTTDPGDKTLVGYAAEVAPPRPAERRPTPTALWALAAGLAFCLVGLGYLYGQVNAKNAVIALQQDRLENARLLEAELERTRDDLARMQDSLAMVATVAQTAYPLRPASTGPVAGVGGPPSGKVFVCGRHQRWYLSLSDLEPAPDGREYHLWFMTRDGMVDAGRFEVEDGIAAMRDLTMPDGTQGFEITLEPVGGSDVPSGEIVLIGDRPVAL